MKVPEIVILNAKSPSLAVGYISTDLLSVVISFFHCVWLFRWMKLMFLAAFYVLQSRLLSLLQL